MAKDHFHSCLLTIFLPVVSLPIIWGLALYDLSRRPVAPEERLWAKRLLVLAVIDTAVGAMLVGLIFTSHSRAPAPPARDTPQAPNLRIGVQQAASAGHRPGAPVGAVLSNSPAERAGISPGDVVTAIDGEPVTDFQQLRDALAAGAPDAPRSLRIKRQGTDLSVTVVPETAAGPTDLFRVWRGPDCYTLARARLSALHREPRFWVIGLIIPGAWLWLRRHRGQNALWGWVAIALGGSTVALVPAMLAVCVATKGEPRAGFLLASLLGSIVMLAIALLARRTAHRDRALDDPAAPQLGTGHAVAVGIYYLVTVLPRAAILLSFVESLAGSHDGVFSTTEHLAAVATGWPGLLASLALVTLVGPLAEELLFRGVIVPRLQPVLGTAGSLGLSSVLFAALHLSYGLYVTPVFLFSVVAGWARLRTGSVRAPVILHMLFNTVVALRLFTR